MDGMAQVEANEGAAEDIEIRRSTLQIEQKKVFFNLRENTRGRYLRIVEVTGSNRSTIILPASGLHQLRELLDQFIQAETAVAQGQQAMMPPNEGGESKSKKRRNKKQAAAGDGGAGADDGRRVFVGNLPWSARWQNLKDHFQQCGEVLRADVFTEQRSGRSRGCGIVEFATPDQAKAAIALSNTEFDGRTIFVREDRG